MSKLAVIHLSDIHIHGAQDPCFAQVERIAAALLPAVREATACLIAITGDVAFSGTAGEYEAFTKGLLKPLQAALEREAGKEIFVSVAPGNHDCVLKPTDEVRETLIEAIVESPAKANNENMVTACTSVQKNFFEFIERSLTPVAEHPSRLLWQQRLMVGDHKVLLTSLNAAWMSRIPETQGQLVYPIERFEKELFPGESSLHLALVHHPFNWYAQNAYQNLRKRLRRACTAVLSGHEHLGNTGKIDEQLSGTSLFFEAAALQPDEKDAVAGFSVHIFDMDSKEVESHAYAIGVAEVASLGAPTRHSWKERQLGDTPELSPVFLAKLNDAGGNFSHTAKERLTLDDVFVWPDVRDWDRQAVNKQGAKSALTLAPRLGQGAHVLVYGDDKAGKSTMLYGFFRELFVKGYFPVYISSHATSLKSKEDPERRITRAIDEQYANPQAVHRAPREKRVILIDDVDRLKSGLHTLPLLLEYAERHFSGICLTASVGFEVANLASKEAMALLGPFENHDMLPFGLKLRHQLIRKWCQLSQVPTVIELDRRVDEVESIVNSVIGKRLVPEYPLYLLILLQSCEQHRHGEIQNSGLSFYYQYLITKSLGGVGVKPSELDEHFNYLSLLAWRFRSLSLKEIDKTQIRIVNDEFCRRFVTVDLSERLELLTRARVLVRRDEDYSFAYPYVYYFFLGRYLAKNIESPEVRGWVEESTKKLYLRDRANAIMFLTHHVENTWVIGLICQVLRECFADKKPVELNGDTAFVGELVQRSAQLSLPALDVEKNQTEVRAIRDELAELDEAEDVEEEASEYALLSFTAKWNLLTKTAQILGQILTNYYGSLERPQKQEMIREVFDGPLRALRLWLEAVADDLPGLVLELKVDALSRNPRLDADRTEVEIKRRLFSLFEWVATSTVAGCGAFVGAEKLREDVSAVVAQTPTNAYRLIEASSRLLRPGKIPIDQVRKLAKDLEKNPYAFGVLQSLGFYHMYMFHTDEPQKQALCEALQISFGAAKAIELKKPGRLLK